MLVLKAGFEINFLRITKMDCDWQARFCCYCLGEIETCTVSPEWTA